MAAFGAALGSTRSVDWTAAGRHNKARKTSFSPSPTHTGTLKIRGNLHGPEDEPSRTARLKPSWLRRPLSILPSPWRPEDAVAVLNLSWSLSVIVADIMALLSPNLNRNLGVSTATQSLTLTAG